MADSSGRGPSRGQRLPDSPGESLQSPAQTLQQSQTQNGTLASSASSMASSERLRTSVHTLHSQDSRFSLHEQFATSRREFDFDADDEDQGENGGPEHLEPAPIISDISIAGEQFLDDNEDDSDHDLEDHEIQALLHAVDDSVDYYTLLGLSRNPSPTATQIRSAYHRLSLAFHPDKHPQAMKAAAEKYFTKLQLAYETLIEPRKKVIYDLDGAEGVQREYKMGGVMSENPERQLGIKAMSADEFKRFYLNIIRSRERQTLEDLVGARGSCKVTLDARKLFDGSEGHVYMEPENGAGEPMLLSLPRVGIRAIQLQQGFGVPLPGLGVFLRNPYRTLSSFFANDIAEELDIGLTRGVNSVPKMTFSGSIGGELDETMAVYQGDPAAPQLQKAPEPYRWQNLNTDNISVSTGIDYVFPEASDRKDASALATMLAETSVDVAVGILPRPSFTVGLGKQIQIIEDTRPFYGYLRTTFEQSLYTKPPALDLRLTRMMAEKQTAYMQWSTGDFAWSEYLQSILPVAKGPLWMPLGKAVSNMRLGWIYSEGRGGIELEDEVDLNEPSEVPGKKERSANESWHVATIASEVNASVQVTYGRDLFMAAPLSPVVSRIMADGNAAKSSSTNRVELAPRGIRLQVEGELSLQSSFTGTIRGLRRVGNFSTIGVGVGLNVSRGLYLSLSWRRLGQSLSLPIILVPLESLTTQAIAWALATPWLAYCTLEFVILRPQLQRKRLKLIERKRKELLSVVQQHRQEAEQAVQLMRPVVEYKQAYEREQGGLVIISAVFGVPSAQKATGPPARTGFKQSEVADVTIATAALIDNSQISIHRGVQKSGLVGYWDPAPLSKKVLIVHYLFEGREHYVEIKGAASLRLPMREHEV